MNRFGKLKEKKIKEKKAVSDKPVLKAMLSSIVMAYAFTAIVFIAYALILTYTNASEAKIPMVVIITTVIAACMAGFDAARSCKEKGLVWGMLAGLLYIVILFILGFLVTKQITFGLNMITMCLIALASGGIGGVLGVNKR